MGAVREARAETARAPKRAVLTNDAIHIVKPSLSIEVTANLWFSIVSVVVLTIAIALTTERIIEPRLGGYRDRHRADAALRALDVCALDTAFRRVVSVGPALGRVAETTSV